MDEDDRPCPGPGLCGKAFCMACSLDSDEETGRGEVAAHRRPPPQPLAMPLPPVPLPKTVKDPRAPSSKTALATSPKFSDNGDLGDADNDEPHAVRVSNKPDRLAPQPRKAAPPSDPTSFEPEHDEAAHPSQSPVESATKPRKRKSSGDELSDRASLPSKRRRLPAKQLDLLPSAITSDAASKAPLPRKTVKNPAVLKVVPPANTSDQDAFSDSSDLNEAVTNDHHKLAGNFGDIPAMASAAFVRVKTTTLLIVGGRAEPEALRFVTQALLHQAVCLRDHVRVLVAAPWTTAALGQIELRGTRAGRTLREGEKEIHFERVSLADLDALFAGEVVAGQLLTGNCLNARLVLRFFGPSSAAGSLSIGGDDCGPSLVASWLKTAHTQLGYADIVCDFAFDHAMAFLEPAWNLAALCPNLTMLVPTAADAVLTLSMPVRKESVRTDSYTLASLALLLDDEPCSLVDWCDQLAFLCETPSGLFDGRASFIVAVNPEPGPSMLSSARSVFGLSDASFKAWGIALLGPSALGAAAVEKMAFQLTARFDADVD